MPPILHEKRPQIATVGFCHPAAPRWYDRTYFLSCRHSVADSCFGWTWECTYRRGWVRRAV